MKRRQKFLYKGIMLMVEMEETEREGKGTDAKKELGGREIV